LTVFKAKKYIAKRLEIITDSALFEATEILAFVTKLERSELIFSKEEKLSPIQLSKIKTVVRKRLSGIPLQYIIGEWEFFGLTFKVGKGVLIPRPDTEIAVETALDLLEREQNIKTVFDFCAGSGAIGISVSVNSPTTDVIMVEKSRKAFKYLKKNLAAHSRLKSINAKAIRKDIFEFSCNKKCDLLISNPPYIKSDLLKTLSKEVQKEPKMALDGGKDGLEFYKKICENAHKYINHGGRILFEIGYDEAKAVAEILENCGFTNIEKITDLNGNDRVMLGMFNPKN
jgi:release factor glutamine methyltransferase